MSEETGIMIKDRIEYWQNKYFEEKEKNKKAIEGILDLYEKEKGENKEIRQWKYVIDTYADLEKLKELDLIKIEGKEYISKDKIKELFKKLNKIKSRTDGKVNAWDYMILGDTTRATGRFINLDYIEKILFDEDGYSIGE